MSNCQFNKIDNFYACEFCGRTSDTTNERVCTVRRNPGLIRQSVNFASSAIPHAIRGNPRCGQEQINDRLNICKTCPYFVSKGEDRGICSHIQCGCNISQEQQYMNKLAWKDEQCPINKWVEIDKKYV